MKLFPIGAIVTVAVLAFATVRAQQPPPSQQPEKTWTMHYEEMMTEMKASDARLQSLTDRMTSARGDEKVPAIQDVVSELVRAQLKMHQHMMMMHDHRTSQMPRQ